MVYVKLFFNLCLLVFSVFSGNLIFGATLIAVLAVSDFLICRYMRDRVNGLLLSMPGFTLIAGILVLTLGIGGTNRYLVFLAALYFSVILARLLPDGIRGISTAAATSPGMLKCTKILDASILMDGRIVDLVGTGFLDGNIVVPRFVMQQIQRIHETGKELKRQRAEHALELIRKLQNMKNVQFRLCEIEFSQEKDVDQRIIALAKKLNGKIVTNDYTLNRVASLEEIEVLNINELANALKPVALPGESINIHIIKKGKEPEQGVGYLDDGTMVVIDGGEAHIGSRVQAKITSVLQNPAGKMIFGTVMTDEEAE